MTKQQTNQCNCTLESIQWRTVQHMSPKPPSPSHKSYRADKNSPNCLRDVMYTLRHARMDGRTDRQKDGWTITNHNHNQCLITRKLNIVSRQF